MAGEKKYFVDARGDYRFIQCYQRDEPIDGRQTKWSRVIVKSASGAVEMPCVNEVYDKYFSKLTDEDFGEKFVGGLTFKTDRKTGKEVYTLCEVEFQNEELLDRE